MERLREQFYRSMSERGITGDVTDEIYTKMRAFANYGFLSRTRCHLLTSSMPQHGSSTTNPQRSVRHCSMLSRWDFGLRIPLFVARRHGVTVRLILGFQLKEPH